MSEARREERGAAEAEGARDGWLERLIGRLGLRGRETPREELEEALDEAAEAADLSEPERAMLSNVLALHTVRVRDIMVPRADIVAASTETSLGELLGLFREAAHSRLAAYGETLDEPLGMIHIRDLVNHIVGQGDLVPGADGEAPTVTGLDRVDLSATLASANLIRPVLFVPGAMPAIDLLASMQASRTHIALVIDEYGGTDGLVSIEDLVETVVGDIEDEHDVTTDPIVPDERGAFVVDARASLKEVSAATGLDLSGGREEVETVGGLVITQAGRVPVRGEKLPGPAGIQFEVVDADRRRLKRLRIRLPEAGEDGMAAAGRAGASGPEV